MVSLKPILLTALIGGAITGGAIPTSKRNPEGPGCGEVNVIMTGLPPYHPLVKEQGFNSSQVDASIRADAADIIKAGYNLRVVLMGPEQSLSILSSQLEGVNWDGTGIGYGVRGSRREDLTIRLEDIIQTYRTQTPEAFIFFDYSPTTGLWAVQRRFPLSSAAGNCADSPGQDLGLEIFCDPDVCTE